MPDPTASLRFVLTGGDLTFSGAEDGNPLGLLSMADPALQARITYADDSAHVEGSLATQAVWQQSLLAAVVELRATSQATLEAQRASLRAAVGQFRFVVVTERNGSSRAWTADMGSMAPAGDPDDFTDLRDFQESWSLSIPVRPTPEVI